MSDHPEIVELLQIIAQEGSLPVQDWSAELPLTPEDIGLSQRDARLFWRDPPQTINLEQVRAALPEFETAVFDLIDSTNTRLIEEASTQSIAHRLYLAEFQYGGRGRRGRTWLSPYGRNLSMSLARSTSRRLGELGGLSLVVGVALAESLERLGVRGVQLKWPNDVLVDDAKLSGVLLELVQRPNAVEYVAGIGVNVSLTADEIQAIGQPVTDLRRCGVVQDRTDLVIALVQKVSAYLHHFEKEGFAPFVRAFNALHKFHGQTCSILQGDKVVTGMVTGIGDSGELVLQTEHGEQRFHGGEVSLRPPDTP